MFQGTSPQNFTTNPMVQFLPIEIKAQLFKVKILSHRHEILEPYLPYNIDYGTGDQSGIENPMMNNLFHLSVWAIAHSTFARHSVKVYITKIIPRHLERPFYVFQSSYLLHNGKNHQVLVILINF